MAASLEPLRLLRTKLYRPRPTSGLIARPRALEILNRRMDRALTLVCAPAGFGKTTLISDWLEHCADPSAWLSLDKGDGELGVFLSYFVAAARTLFPEACANTHALLRAPALPPFGHLATALVNDLDEMADNLAPDERFIFVLDDYHLVSNSAVDALLTELLRHLSRSLHLVISTRRDPPFPVHTLRAQGQLTEIRIAELRFTAEEVGLFMQAASDTPFDAEVIGSLVDLTEGWSAGLRLAALALNVGGDVAGSLTSSGFDNQYAMGYLLNEVLSHVSLPAQEFLLATSILDRLCEPLCDAVVGATDMPRTGDASLEAFVANNLFTFSLDEQGVWYRYHHLFQKMLRNQLMRRRKPDEIAGLHRRASHWLAQNGDIDEAIEHALAGGDEMAAVRLVEANRHKAINHENWRQLERWLSLMPRSLVERRLELLLMQAWLLTTQWRITDLPPLLQRMEQMIASGDSALTGGEAALGEAQARELKGEVDALRAVLLFYVFDAERAIASARRALQAVPLRNSGVRGVAWLYLAGGLHLAGQTEAAYEAILEGLQEDRLHRNSFATRVYMAFCIVRWLEADVQGMLTGANQMLLTARERDLPEAVGWAHYFRGCALYHMNDLDGAEEAFVSAERLRYLTNGNPYSQSAFGLARVLAARGKIDEARALIESVAGYALEIGNPRIIADADAARAWAAQQAGADAQALRWALAYDLNAPPVPLTTFTSAQALLARVLVSASTAPAIDKAAHALSRLRELAVQTHSRQYLVEVLALQAVFDAAQGNYASALEALRQGVKLAEPGGLVRLFVELGPAMAGLLQQLAAGPAPAPFLQKLVAACADEAQARREAAPSTAPAEQAGGLTESLAQREPLAQRESLSPRELDVLVLLAQRMVDKEIARELSISPMTVKRHASNIYRKLGVSNRRDAVVRGAALGLVPPPAAQRRRPQRPQ